MCDGYVSVGTVDHLILFASPVRNCATGSYREKNTLTFNQPIAFVKTSRQKCYNTYLK